MPLLFSSLFVQGAGAAPPPPPFTWTTNLLYRFSASDEVFSDAAGTVPAVNADPVALWGNLGSAENARQSTPALRPVYRTGGLNGRPYIACDRSLQQFFEDLAFTQPSGLSTLNPFTVFAVTDAVGALSDFPALLGSTAANGGKIGFYFRAPAGEQIHWIKSQIRLGNIANPQVLMCAAGRNADGATSTPSTRFWIRQNRANVFSLASQSSNLVSDAIASMQFLRSSGISSGGFFHGRLYESQLYQGTLSNADTFAIEDWLHTRYGIA